MTTTSFKSILEKSWLRVTAVIGFVYFVAFTLTLALISNPIQQKNADHITAHLVSSIGPLLQIGDEYSTIKKLGGLTSGNEILGVKLTFSDGKTLKSLKRGISNDLFSGLSESKNSWNEYFSVFNDLWYFQRNYEIFPSEKVKIEVVHSNADVAKIVKLGVAGAALFTIIAFVLTMLLSRSTIVRITKPVRVLAKFLSSGRPQSEIPPLLMEISETKDAVETYISTSKELEEQVELRGKFEGMAEVAQMAAHDVKRPFTLLRMALEEARTVKNPKELEQFLSEMDQDINNAMDSAEGLIDEILEMGAINSLQMSEFDPAEAIESALNLSVKMNRSRNLSISYDFAHLHQVKGDRKRIIRVLSNLVANAVDAAPNGGKIWFRTSDENNGTIKITVGNDGSYIEISERKQVFDAFYSKGKIKGTGLGLAICKKIVEEHHGEIWCDADKVFGTEFSFTLGATNKSRYVPQELPSKFVGATRNGIQLIKGVGNNHNSDLPKVAFIDDDRIVRRCWAKSLKNGFEVNTFSSVSDFSDSLSGNDVNEYECIITDFYLNSQTGDDLAVEVKKVYSGPIIVCTDTRLSDEQVQVFDGKIGKTPLTASQLNLLLSSNRSVDFNEN